MRPREVVARPESPARPPLAVSPQPEIKPAVMSPEAPGYEEWQRRINRRTL